MRKIFALASAASIAAFAALPASAQEAATGIQAVADNGESELILLGTILGALVVVAAGVSIVYEIALKGMTKTKQVVRRA